MTTAVAVQSPRDLQQSLPEHALRLLQERQITTWQPVTVERDGGTAQAMGSVFNPPTPAEEATLRALNATLEARLQQAPRGTTEALLARLAAHDPRDRSATEWKMIFEDYAEDLGEFSEAHLRQAISEHRRTNKWFPKVSELRERCLELRALDTARALRCRRSLGIER